MNELVLTREKPRSDQYAAGEELGSGHYAGQNRQQGDEGEDRPGLAREVHFRSLRPSHV